MIFDHVPTRAKIEATFPVEPESKDRVTLTILATIPEKRHHRKKCVG